MPSPSVTPQRWSLAGYTATWLAVTTPRVKPATAAVYRWAAAWITRLPIGTRPLEDLRRPDVRGLVADLFLAGLEQQSVSRVVGCVRTILNAAIDDDLLTTNVASRVGALLRGTCRGPVRAVVRLPAAAVDRMVASSEHWALAVLLLCLARTGLRIGEVLGLRWEDYDADAGTLTVRRQHGRYGVLTPKNGRTRVVGVSPQLAHGLATLRGPAASGWCFPGPRGDRPWSRTTIRTRLRTIGVAAGTANLHPHAFRHAFATQFAAVTDDLRDVQAALGHATLAQTEQYVHQLRGADRRLFAKLDGQSDER